jgi:hypothetical protein
MTKAGDELRQQVLANLQKKVSEALAEAGQPIKEGTFKLAIVKQDAYHNSPFCPHCATSTLPEVKWTINDNSRAIAVGRILGDLAVCKICNQPMFIMQYPILPLRTTIFMNWKIKGEEVKENVGGTGVSGGSGQEVLSTAVRGDEGTA